MMAPQAGGMSLILTAGALVLTACQTESAARPAVLLHADAAARSQVQAAAAAALGRGRVELGPEDLTTSSTVSVLPAPPSRYQDRNPGLPIRFRLLVRGEECLLKRQDTGQLYPLSGLACRPAE